MRAYPAGSDDDLLRRMQDGDEEAFVAIYRRYQGGIYRFALHMTGNSAMAEEVTQEVFMTLIGRPERFDSQKGSLQAFLFGIGRNHTLHCLEREREFMPLSRGEEWAADARGSESGKLLDDLVREESVERVREAVKSLPTKYREVVALCDLEEKSYAEAAQILACAVGTIRSRLHRARGLLLAKLEVLHGAPANLNG
ncbi:MAG: RNA polymerase sigma factor [Terriglobia bacterium]